MVDGVSGLETGRAADQRRCRECADRIPIHRAVRCARPEQEGQRERQPPYHCASLLARVAAAVWAILAIVPCGRLLAAALSPAVRPMPALRSMGVLRVIPVLSGSPRAQCPGDKVNLEGSRPGCKIWRGFPVCVVAMRGMRWARGRVWARAWPEMFA